MAQERLRHIQYVNVLRIIAIYAVVAAHVAVWLARATPAFTFNWWLGCWIFYTAHFSIPVFVMISGALLLDDVRQETAMQFYRRRMVRVGIPLVIWTVVYFVVRVVVHGETLSVARVVRLILTGDVYYHLWFLYMIFGLYLITPTLRSFIRYCPRSQRLFLIVFGLIVANAYYQSNAILWDNQRSIFTMFLPFIPYYLCGYELRLIDPKKVPSVYLILAVVASALYLAAFSGVFLATAGGLQKGLIFDYFGLPQIVLSIAVFWAAYLYGQTSKPLQGFPKTAIEWVASTTLGVYVLHPLLLWYIQDRLGRYAGGGNFLIAVTVVPLVAFIACYLLTSLLMNIPVLKRTVC
jgi:surface polysaccharide O-acyltransferase-like enzyme